MSQYHHKNYNQQETVHYFNIFDDLKKRKSILLTLFDLKNTELLNVGAQAPAPSKDYCQLILTYNYVLFRWWKITLRADSETRYPGEIKDTYEDFVHDETIQRNIANIFGKDMFVYVNNIVEKGKLDYINRLPEKILVRIISHLDLESVARLAQVNSLFRQLCRSDMVWIKLYRKYYSTEITPGLCKLAENSEFGWRKLFFTNKLKLQLELRRQANKKVTYDDEVGSGYYTNRRSINDDSKSSKTRNSKSASRHNVTSKSIGSTSSKLRHSTFITEN